MPDETPGWSLERLHEGSQITAVTNKLIALVILRKTRHTAPENLGKLPSKHVSFKDWILGRSKFFILALYFWNASFSLQSTFFFFFCWKLNQKFECEGTSPLHHSHQPVVRTVMIHLPKHCHMYVFYSAVYVTGANANKIEIIEARRLISSAHYTVLAHI